MASVRIAFVGDVCPGGVLHGSAAPCVSREVSDYLAQFDLRVGTLEAAFGSGMPFDPKKTEISHPVIYAPSEDVRRLRELRLDVVSLANNHVTDLGLAGLRNTMDVLDANRILHVGAGRNAAEAASPAVVDLKGFRIAFLACYDTTVAPHPASETSWGVCTSEQVFRAVQTARAACDLVVVLPHWGAEHSSRPLPEDTKTARQLIRAGADGVFGSHTHQVQPWVVFRGKPVFYSLGNFLFPDYYRHRSGYMLYAQDSGHPVSASPTSGQTPEAQTVVKETWSRSSRVGMIADVSLGNECRVSFRLTLMDRDNRVGFLRNARRPVLTLAVLGQLARSPAYRAFYLLAEALLFARRRLPFGLTELGAGFMWRNTEGR